MEGSPAQNEKWNLTRQALDSFLTYLDADRNRAGERYEQLRRTLMTFFQCNGFSNVEDPVDETIVSFRQA